MNPVILHPLIAAALAGATLAAAQQAAPPLPPVTETVVVTANATPTDLAEVGSSVTVIDAFEIEARKATSVLELLRTVPGLEVVQGGGPGRAASVMIRGAASSHTLVLLDGVRLNSPATGAYDLSDLRADQIERIEVLRGPQSSLYGSEAIGGVINILTRDGTAGPRLQARGDVGTAASSRLQATVGGARGAVDARVTVSTERVDGISVASEASGNSEADPYRVSSAAARLGVRLGEAARGTLVVRGLDATTGLDGFEWGTGPVDDTNYTQDRSELAAGLTLEIGGDAAARHRLRLGGNRERLVGHDPDTAFNTYDVDTRVAEAAWQSDLTLGSTDVLSVGLSREQRHAESRGAYDEDVAITGAFAENQWSPSPRLAVTAAVRHDAHSTFGAHTTARATVAARPSLTGLRAHASWGTAFKAPTFNDLFFPGFGNPDLAPETSSGWETGVGFMPERGGPTVDVTWFDSRIDDLIGFDFQTFRAANVDRARIRGLEATAGVLLAEGARVDASYTLTDSEDLSTGRELARRPRHRVTLTAAWAPGAGVSGTLTVIAVRDRTDSDGTRLADYEKVDASVAVGVADGVTVHVTAENLLGERYEELSGYTSPGFRGWVGVTVRP